MRREFNLLSGDPDMLIVPATVRVAESIVFKQAAIVESMGQLTFRATWKVLFTIVVVIDIHNIPIKVY